MQQKFRPIKVYQPYRSNDTPESPNSLLQCYPHQYVANLDGQTGLAPFEVGFPRLFMALCCSNFSFPDLLTSSKIQNTKIWDFIYEVPVMDIRFFPLFFWIFPLSLLWEMSTFATVVFRTGYALHMIMLQHNNDRQFHQIKKEERMNTYFT